MALRYGSEYGGVASAVADAFLTLFCIEGETLTS